MDNEVQKITNVRLYSKVVNRVVALYDPQVDHALEPTLSYYAFVFCDMSSVDQSKHIAEMRGTFRRMFNHRLLRLMGNCKFAELVARQHVSHLHYVERYMETLNKTSARAICSEDVLANITLIICMVAFKHCVSYADAHRFVRLARYMFDSPVVFVDN